MGPLNESLRQRSVSTCLQTPSAVHRSLKDHAQEYKQGFQVLKAHSNWIHAGLTSDPWRTHSINNQVKDLDGWMSPGRRE